VWMDALMLLSGPEREPDVSGTALVDVKLRVEAVELALSVSCLHLRVLKYPRYHAPLPRCGDAQCRV
jgi:hypothetical protein